MLRTSLEDQDLMNLYLFQDVQFAKVQISASQLWKRRLKLSVQEVRNDGPRAPILVFDSQGEEHFQIKEQEFSFNVLAKRLPENKVRMDFRFMGYGFTHEFKVAEDERDFRLMPVQAVQETSSITPNENVPILKFASTAKLPETQRKNAKSKRE